MYHIYYILFNRLYMSVDGESRAENEKEIWKYLTRAERMNRTKFPDSNNKRIVLRGKGDGFGFIYKIEEGLIQHIPCRMEELDQTVKECNTIISRLYCEKRRNDEYDFLKSNTGFLQLIFLVAIIGFVILAVSDYNRSSSVLFYVGLGILATSGALVIVIASLLIFREKKYINLNREMNIRLTKHLESVNSSLSNRRIPMTYILEKEHRWIEIEIG